MTVRKKKKRGLPPIVGIFILVMAVVFMPTTIILFFGMLPTVVAAVIDRTKTGSRALTVGSMNLAGCTPFLFDLWMTGHDTAHALEIISDPLTIIVIYCASAVGYVIDWSMAGLVAALLVQRSRARLQDIDRHQARLIERWGPEVVGDIPLDEYGFPLDSGN